LNDALMAAAAADRKSGDALLASVPVPAAAAASAPDAGAPDASAHDAGTVP